jgi:alkanesulfonate monooxygenase SsuD/methylene tetrahydromethanopterin reductase-like flavin-dependent oxidoreductase (luciferase family)
MKRVAAAKIQTQGKIQTAEDLVRMGVVIVGSPATVRERLAEYQDLAGFNTSLTKTQFGTLPRDMTKANQEAIAEEVLPYFRDRVPAAKEAAAAPAQ